MRMKKFAWTLLALLALCLPALAGAEGASLVISEAMSRNPALWQLDYQDYIEFYNAGDTALELSDYTLCRGDNLEKKCRLPARTVQPGEYAVLLCDGSEITFSLPKEGCRLTLLRGEETADALTLPALQKGEVWTRENGVSMQPSPGYANTDEGGTQCYQSTQRALAFSEALSCNVSTMRQEYEYYDMLELCNTSGGKLQLSDFYLTDDLAEPLKWQLSAREINPGAYYTVFASGLGGKQANFKLSASGETVYIFRADGTIVDAMRIPALRGDESYGVWRGLYYYYEKSTFGKDNGAGARGVSAAPQMSLETGLYDQPIAVSLSGEGTIYYTTDGSRPTLKSKKYDGTAIAISDTTAVRAMCVKDGYLASDVTTRSYLYGMEKYELPLLLITGKYDDLLGGNGIYKNYKNRRQEAAINLTLVEEGQMAFSVDCGVKIHGNSSRERPKKSFQIRFRSKYGASTFTYPLFEHAGVDTFHSLILRSGSEDQNRSFFRDEFLGSLTRETMPNVLYLDYKPVNLFVDGKYYGIYYIRERTDTTYVSQHLGGDDEQVDIINSWQDLEQGSMGDWSRLNTFCLRKDLTDPANYNEVLSQISLDGFIDYYIARAYSGDRDYCNIRVCRSRAGDNRWYIVNFDLDWGFTIAKTPLVSMLGKVSNTSSLNNVIITGLLKNQDFRAQFLSRMALHLSTTFDTQRVLNRLDEMVAEVAHDMPYNQDRWGYSMEKWQEYVQLLRDFVQDDQGTRVMEMMQDAQRLFSLSNDEMTAIFGEMWTNGR